MSSSAEPIIKPDLSREPLVRPSMPELDTCRGIAVLSVLVYHAFFGVMAAAVSVAVPGCGCRRPPWGGLGLIFFLCYPVFSSQAYCWNREASLFTTGVFILDVRSASFLPTTHFSSSWPYSTRRLRHSLGSASYISQTLPTCSG